MRPCGPKDATGEPVDRDPPRAEADRAQTAAAPGVVEACVRETDALFLSGTHHCAEAVVSVIRAHFSPETPEDVVRLVSGLGGGCGVGCICGAISGATIAFGMVLREDKQGVEESTRAVHEWFKDTYGTACCRALQHKDRDGCRVNPGAVAGKVAELLLAGEKGSGS